MRRAILAYLGTGTDAKRVAAEAARCELQRAFDGQNLHVFAGADIPVLTLPGGALVLGDIFSRTGGACHAPADGWGNFVAFESAGQQCRILRAPLTGRAMFLVRYGAGLLCTSHLELISSLAAFPALDWDSIAHGLVYPNLRTERTGLAGVSELLPGMALEVAPGITRITTAWSPWDHVDRPSHLGVAELAPLLERSVIATMASWTRARPDIVLELSGGLDSSIVAAALTAAGAAVRAVTFVTAGADGDERLFARAVAAHCGFNLAELPLDDSHIDLVAPPRVPHVRPGAYGVLGGIDRAFAEAEGSGDAAIFGGIGGDNIFAFDTTVAPILDAYAAFGIGRRTFGTIRDVARAGNATFWQALRLAARAHRAGHRGWRRGTRFCNAGQMPDHPFEHPWDADAGGYPRGKRNHVTSLRRILDFVDRPGRWQGRDVVAPLLSQPLVELCLSIPSWTWLAGGRDRAVARAAFAARLPSHVVWRRGKGQLETLCSAAYLAQRPAVRELLLGGRLAERGLLDRPAIETYLARELGEGDFDYLRLLEIADVERWIRSVETGCGPSARQR